MIDLPSTYDLLLNAEQHGTGLKLDPNQVGDLVEEIEEMRLQWELSLIMAHKVIDTLTGTKPDHPVN